MMRIIVSMFHRVLDISQRLGSKSGFVFGPRSTGKSFWIRKTVPSAMVFDLLDSDVYGQLLRRPRQLGEVIDENFRDWVVIDEIQKIPALLDEVHRLIETSRLKFILTGSSARKLRRG
ncbi:MAG: AAA family ATPase, partial [Bdellovibrionota bacterium]